METAHSTESSSATLLRDAIQAFRSIKRRSPPIIRNGKVILIQALWSTIVTVITFLLSIHDSDSSKKKIIWSSFAGASNIGGGGDFWTTKFSISSFIIKAVGWALFALLSFLVKEAAARRREAQGAWIAVTTLVQQAVRQLIQVFPSGTWHPNDRQRLLAHMAAYPIAVTMTIRETDSSGELLDGLLHKDDFQQIMSVKNRNLMCTRIVRAYLIASEPDVPAICKVDESFPCPGSEYVRNFPSRIIDRLDEQAAVLLRIKEFHPSHGFINHLKLFMHIWFFFVPFAFVRENGWFTILWSVLIVYCVGSIFVIASKLNNPFGDESDDINLELMAAEAALAVTMMYEDETIDLSHVVRQSVTENDNARDYFWLHNELSNSQSNVKTNDTAKLRTRTIRFLRKILDGILYVYHIVFDRCSNRSVFVPLLWYSLWVVVSVILSWCIHLIVTKTTHYEEKCQPWCTYIGPHPYTTSAMALGVLFLVGFWMMDSYEQYWRGVLLWSNDLRHNITHLAMHFALTCEKDLWHPDDRERIFSYLAAIPYVVMQNLRESRDLSVISTMFSEQEYSSLCSAPDQISHCFHIVYAYMNSASDPGRNFLNNHESPFQESMFRIQDNVWAAEDVVMKCKALHRYPISPTLTRHLRVFLYLWLTLLPLSMITEDGFLTIFCCILIGYSTINMFALGQELSDPFGTDPDDLPLEDICDEIKKSVQAVYKNTTNGPASYVKKSTYSRSTFQPIPQSSLQQLNEKEDKVNAQRRIVTDSLRLLRKLFGKIQNRLPQVSLTALLVCFCWAIVSSLISYGLSFLWDQSNCKRAWRCSPIDIDSNVLNYTGFGLFLLLGFRAKDALSRYEHRFYLLYELENHLRSLAVQFVQCFPDNTWHEFDKERVIAHILQIPISFRNELLRNDSSSDREMIGLLSKEDQVLLERSENGVHHCCGVVQSYLLSIDSNIRNKQVVGSDFKIATRLVRSMLNRLNSILLVVHHVRTVRRFPVVKGFTKHQHVFTAIWLFLLPLGMLSVSGFYTIIWSTLISYAVLSLDSLAHELLDSDKRDCIDIPVAELCSKAADTIVEAVNSVKWNHMRHILETTVNGTVQIGMNITQEPGIVRPNYQLARFTEMHENDEPFTENSRHWVSAPREKMTQQTLFAHLLHSVPWWLILAVLAWTLIAVYFSNLTRDMRKSDEERWWIPSVKISSSVAIYFSFATFLLLSIYVEIGYQRYKRAGFVWRDNLRSQCHSLFLQWLNLFPEGTWHKGDHRRVMGHIIGIAVGLKMELRGTRDIRELGGVLSQEDLGRIHCAESITLHCIDVVRSYFLAAAAHMSSLEVPCKIKGTKRLSNFWRELTSIETSVTTCKFLKHVEIAPTAYCLLNFLLGLWVLVLPLILAEMAGWMTLVIMPLIAYGLLGLYKITEELTDPFGTDLNDFDLDERTDRVARDLTYMQRNYVNGFETLIQEGTNIEQFSILTSRRARTSDKEYKQDEKERENKDQNKLTLLKCAFQSQFEPVMNVASWKYLFGLAIWSLFLTWLTTQIHAKTPKLEGNDECNTWWCSPAALNSRIFKFSGYALFLLLSKRLHDTHEKYTNSLIQWRERMSILTALLSNRIFSSSVKGSWHNGDFERVGGHLAAYSLTAASELRNWSLLKEGKLSGNEDIDLQQNLQEILTKDDIHRVMACKYRADYCLDVVLAYIISRDYDNPLKASSNGTRLALRLTSGLRTIVAESKTIQREDMPFGFYQHLRVFMFLWIGFLPLGIVESSGWLTTVWVLLIALGITGVEKLSRELADPFGTDCSDIPLDRLQMKSVREIEENLQLFGQQGTCEDMIKTDRGGLEGKIVRDSVSINVE